MPPRSSGWQTSTIQTTPSSSSERGRGQFTSGTTGVITDNTVTMTIALVPLAIMTVPIEQFQLY
jgi:cation:H+ antiporter